MKNIKIFLSAMVVCAMSYGGYTAYQAATMTEAERALMENVEALTSGETIHVSNFKSATVYYSDGYHGGMAVSSMPSWTWGVTWKSMVCCVNGSDIDACKFSCEDRECERRVIRSGRS